MECLSSRSPRRSPSPAASRSLLARQRKAKQSLQTPGPNTTSARRNHKYPIKLVSPVGGAIKKGVADGTYDDPWEDDQEPAKPAAAPQVWTFVASEKVDRALRKLKSGERPGGSR